MLRQFLFLFVMTVSCVGLARGQEATGETAQKIKKEVLSLVEAKRQAFLSRKDPGNHYVDWIKRYYAEGAVDTNPDGLVRDKAYMIGEAGRGNLQSSDQSVHEVHVYGNGGNGTTVVVVLSAEEHLVGEPLHSVDVLNGQRENIGATATEVWVKVDGRWWLVTHSVHHPPRAAKSATKPK